MGKSEAIGEVNSIQVFGTQVSGKLFYTKVHKGGDIRAVTDGGGILRCKLPHKRREVVSLVGRVIAQLQAGTQV